MTNEPEFDYREIISSLLPEILALPSKSNGEKAAV
jgi:hypothetical protein